MRKGGFKQVDEQMSPGFSEGMIPFYERRCERTNLIINLIT